MERREVLTGGLGLMTLALLSRAAQAQDQQQISWWMGNTNPPNQELLNKLLVEAFNSGQPDYQLTVDYRGASLDTQLRVALLSGSGPDIVLTAGPTYVAAIARAGQLLPLNDYAEKLGWNDRLLPVFLEQGTYEGSLYALPGTYETLGIFYNKTLFEANGWTPPVTTVELEALADAMLAKGMVPFAAGNGDWRPANEWYVTLALNSIAGPENVYKALIGELDWTAEPFVKAIDTLKAWWDKGYFGRDYFSLTTEQAFAQVATGQAGMSPSGTWNFQNVPTYFPANNAEPGFAGFPSDPAIGAPIYCLGVGWTLSISSTSPNPDGAAAVMDFVFSDKFYGDVNSVWQGEWNLPLRDLSQVQITGTALPSYTEAMKNLAAAVAAGNYGYTSWTYFPPATENYLVSGIEEVWLDKVSTADFLAKVDQNFKEEQAAGLVPAIPAR